jgi:hypothetical protein
MIFGVEVIESTAVPPDTVIMCDKSEFDKLMSKAQDEVIKRLTRTGLFSNVSKGLSKSLQADGPSTPRFLKWYEDGSPAGTLTADEWDWLMQNSTTLKDSGVCVKVSGNDYYMREGL